MTDTTTITARKPKRPRSTRYNGRTSREVLIPEALDAWINAQMGAKWSRNQVIEQCINIAMGKVETAGAQEDAIAASLARMQTDLDALAVQVRAILAILTVDTKLRYATQDSPQPQTFGQHKALVQETVQRMMRNAE